jgi:hypothetical protein
MWFLATMTFVLACALGVDWADAQDQTQRQKKSKALGRLGVGSELLSAQGLEKLNLTKDQQEKFAKLNVEFQEKQKELQSKLDAAKKDRDRNKLKEATQAAQKLRPEFLTRVEGILTDTQKKTFEGVRDASPVRTRPGVTPVRPGAVTPETPGTILSPQLQERLKLSAEQKKKLDEMQKDVDAKLRSLLTEEQRKLLEPQGGKDARKKKRPTNRRQSNLESGGVTATHNPATARLDKVRLLGR